MEVEQTKRRKEKAKKKLIEIGVPEKLIKEDIVIKTKKGYIIGSWNGVIWKDEETGLEMKIHTKI